MLVTMHLIIINCLVNVICHIVIGTLASCMVLSQQETKCRLSRNVIEFCEIRDRLAFCGKVTNASICKLINSDCLE